MLILHRFAGKPFAGVLLVLAVCTSYAGTRADFLIAGEVRSLTIYNQYQQRLTHAEAAGMFPYVPFRILRADDMLGDGFTPCMKVMLDGKTYYIEKDTDGALRAAPGFLKIYRNAEVLDDTVEILQSNRAMLEEMQPNTRVQLQQGTKLFRVFFYEGMTFVREPGAQRKTGWMNFAALVSGRDWRIARESGASLSDQIEKVVAPVQAKVEELNATLSRLFAYFNQHAPRQYPAPQWRVDRSATELVCRLETDIPPARFAESSRLLGKSIEGMTLGTQLSVTVVPGRIEVR